MTEEQRKAKTFLDRYKRTCTEIKYIEAEIDSLRGRAEKVQSANAVEYGWTGLTKEDKQGRRTKVMMPVPRSKPQPGNSEHESVMCQLADKSEEYRRAQGEAARLREEIEYAIDAATDNIEYRTVLKMRHLLGGMTYEDMGDAICYTARHASRIYYEALRLFGRKLEG